MTIATSINDDPNMSILPLQRGDHINNWAAWMEAGGYAERTITERTRTIHTLENRLHIPAHTATPRHLQKFLAQPWKPNTRQTYQHTLKAFYTWLQDNGVRPDNPTDRLPRTRVPRRHARPMSDTDVEKVFRTRMHTTTRNMLILATYAGMRVHEIAKVHSNDVDLDNGLLTVTGKGGHTRYMPMHTEVLRAAEGQTGYWFPNSKDNKLGPAGTAHVLPNGVSAIISQVFKRAGVEGTPHALRHRFATNLLNNGVDIRVVQTLMGHASMNTTALYIAVDPKLSRAAIDTL